MSVQNHSLDLQNRIRRQLIDMELRKNNSAEARSKPDAHSEGQLSETKTKEHLKEYKYSQKDGAELAIDTLVGLTSLWVFKSAKKAGIMADTLFLRGKTAKIGPKMVTAVAGAGAAIASGIILKPILKGLSALGMSSEERKKERTIFKDMVTGAIDGALAPLAFTKNLAVGLSGIFGTNMLSRYIFIKKEEDTDEKSVKDFAQKQTQGIALKLLCATVAVCSIVRGRANIARWENAAEKAIENTKHFELFKRVNRPSEFQELVDQIGFMKDGKITQIIEDASLSIEGKMLELEKYNIFLPKYLQTIPDNTMDGALGKVVSRLKDDCPTSRTLEEAKEVISKTFGNKYDVQNNIGTGTVAETYLAKSEETGMDVVIKILKKNISAEKIEEDRKHILELIEKSDIEDSAQLEYYKKRVNSLFDAWIKEVDLELESKAAVLLGKNARSYSVVKPIEVKDNIYVMERAPGVQFNHFVDDLGKNEKVITIEQMTFLFMQYFRAFFEQLLSVPKKGMKVMHADPHPGNVFINMENIKQILHFIDTGNVLRYTPKEAITNTFNHIDYLIGNANSVAKAMLKDAVLPENMTHKQAVELLTRELNENVYNIKTYVPRFDYVNDFCAHVMRENKIISNPNNTNLLKAEATYLSNLKSLTGIWDHLDTPNDIFNPQFAKELNKKMAKERKELLKEIGRAVWNSCINNTSHTLGEIKSRTSYISDNKEKFLTSLLGLGKGML